jgi:PadR family transcriptional regulator PadR
MRPRPIRGHSEATKRWRDYHRRKSFRGSSARPRARLCVEVRGVMTTPKSDLPQGTLDLLVLKVVALGPLHGYAIGQRLQQISRDVVQVQQGTLYPALHRLENRGLLIADWKLSDTGREAKFYRLTRRGRSQLESQTASWQRLTEAVGLILYTGTAEGEAQ